MAEPGRPHNWCGFETCDGADVPELRSELDSARAERDVQYVELEQTRRRLDALQDSLRQLCALNGVEPGSANVATLERLVEALGGKARMLHDDPALPGPAYPAWVEAVDREVMRHEPHVHTLAEMRVGPVRAIQELSRTVLSQLRRIAKLAELQPPRSIRIEAASVEGQQLMADFSAGNAPRLRKALRDLVRVLDPVAMRRNDSGKRAWAEAMAALHNEPTEAAPEDA